MRDFRYTKDVCRSHWDPVRGRKAHFLYDFNLEYREKENSIMKAFMDKEFMLQIPTAQHLYHDLC